MSQTKAQLLDGKSATIQFTGGSASAPSVSFTGDTNTGIYSPGADQVAISTGGSGRLFVDANGNLSVGGQSNRGKIVALGSGYSVLVLGTTSSSGARGGAINFESEAPGADGQILYDTNSDYMSFSTNANERLRITSTGLVGVGTSAPDELLTVASGTDRVGINVSGTVSTLLIGNRNPATSCSSISFDRGDGSLRFNNGVTGAITERARIDSSGRVGIGTSSPEAPLDVVTGSSGAIFRFSTASTNLQIIPEAANGNVGIRFAANSGAAPNLQFRNDAGSNLVTITNGGNVGIGTTPVYKLDVSGGAGDGIRYQNTANSVGVQVGASSGSAQIGSTTSHPVEFLVGSIERARIDSSGRLLVGTSTYDGNGIAVFQGNTSSSTGAGAIDIRLGTTRPTAADTPIGYLRFVSTSQTSSNNQYANIAAFSDGASTSDGDIPGRLVFSTTADGASSPTERMRITNNGKIGIANDGVIQQGSGIGGGSAAGILELYNGGTGNTTLENTGNFPIVFRTNGSERARITGNGFTKASNTGAYYSSGGGYHEMYSNQSNYVAIISSAGASPYGQFINYSTTPNGTSNEFLVCADASATRMTVRSNGGISNYQANDTNLCDEREKKNIEDLESTWSCLKNWSLKKFHYNSDADSEAKKYGVIAQQIEEHCPEVIAEWVKQKATPAKLDEEGNELEPAKEEIVRLGVKEQQMYWMAIKALQEAQMRIEALEAEVAALKAQ